MNDPLIKDRITDENVKVLVNDMIKNTLKFLPKEWQNQL